VEQHDETQVKTSEKKNGIISFFIRNGVSSHVTKTGVKEGGGNSFLAFPSIKAAQNPN
jgi:hypothetical protein